MGKRHREGFSLVELMVVLMVAAIALGMGVPAMSDLAAANRMAASANDIVGTLQAARQAALSTRAPVTVCASSGWNGDHPACEPAGSLLAGWIAFRDPNGNGVLDAAEAGGLLGRHGPLHDEILHQPGTQADAGAAAYVQFDAAGHPAVAMGLGAGIRSVQLCDHRGGRATSGEAAGRLIVVEPSGRVALLQSASALASPDNALGGCGS